LKVALTVEMVIAFLVLLKVAWLVEMTFNKRVV
jgi:hypothetical protein